MGKYEKISLVMGLIVAVVSIASFVIGDKLYGWVGAFIFQNIMFNLRIKKLEEKL